MLRNLPVHLISSGWGRTLGPCRDRGGQGPAHALREGLVGKEAAVAEPARTLRGTQEGRGTDVHSKASLESWKGILEEVSSKRRFTGQVRIHRR